MWYSAIELKSKKLQGFMHIVDYGRNHCSWRNISLPPRFRDLCESGTPSLIRSLHGMCRKQMNSCHSCSGDVICGCCFVPWRKFTISLTDCLLVILLEWAFHFVLNQNIFSKLMVKEVNRWICAGLNFLRCNWKVSLIYFS